MLLPTPQIERSFAGVYDALYADGEFLALRTAFLDSVFAACPPGAWLLDAGCGTGSQADALRGRGWRVAGLDSDPLMLAVARQKWPRMPLVRGDLAALPFRAAFAGVLCLESPLAYLLNDARFALALRGLRQAMAPAGWLVVDTFDYPASLGVEGTRKSRSRFQAGKMTVEVAESHSYDEQAGVWTMRQRFAVGQGDRPAQRFEIAHRLKVRSADEHASALERAGFRVAQILPAYPRLPDRLRSERRIIVVAQAE